MAINNNNVKNVKFLRNQNPFVSREAARQGLEQNKTQAADGTALLARYTVTDGQTTDVKTLVGFVAEVNSTKYVTIFDVEGASADVEKLRQEIDAKLGTGITSENTATAQLAALRGNPATAQSGDTSVEGAKRYADAKISDLDYTGVTTGTGVYVTNVTQSDGIVSATTATLPSVADSAVAKKFVTEVDQTNGEISVSRGEITSTDKTIKLTDGNDGGINFAVNIDGETIVKDANTGVLSVANSALVEYVGDDATINVSAPVNNKKTISTLLTLSSITPSSTTVKEEYALVDASGVTKGSTVKIYKDSSLYNVYLGHTDDAIAGDPPVVTPGTGDAALCFIYHKEDGTYELVPVNVESFLEESEFASGVTADSTTHIVHGVVDPSSETFLTVGTGGFKLSGVQDAIDDAVATAVSGLDATVTAETANHHISISIEETDGKLVQSGLAITESDIASATDLGELSGKTVTEIASSNNSISATSTAATDGTVSVDLVTDASKIKMSGFTSTDVLSGITSSSSITEAFKEVDKVITDNEETVSAALNNLEATKIENIEVNGVSGTVTDNVASVTIDGNDVVLGADYVKPSQGSPIATGDTVDQALGKLEAKVDAAVASGVTSIVAGNGIAVNAAQTTTPTVSAKLTSASDLASIGIAENAIKFDATSAPGMYIEYLDCGFYE